VTVATHAGDDLYAGWNAAALVAGVLTLVGAAAIALTGRRSTYCPGPICQSSSTPCEKST
jgi:hypothetical protein